MHEEPVDPWKAWRGRITAARSRREDKVGDWQTNVEKRKGEYNDSGSTSQLGSTTPASVSVNKDWPLTKAKIALLYSQTPQVRPSSDAPQLAQILPQFSKTLNQTIRDENVGAKIEEELADVINASGISAVHIACTKRIEVRDVPQFDPMIAGMSGIENPMIPTQFVADIRYPVRRISPARLLIPADFDGSVYDEARWLGYEDAMPWASAVSEFGLTEDQKHNVCGSDKKYSGNLTLNTDTSKYRDTDAVNFQEIYYRRHFYHEDETSFSALQRVVFVDGVEEPVINEPYQGQTRLPDGRVVGVTKNPIQVITLAYVSDDALPPSDSTISRPQVTELEDSRTQMALQRKHSVPIRWFDTNRVSAGAKSLLEKGTFQGFVGTNGPGDRAIGEIARASFPPEKYELDRVIGQEITDQWSTGPNQSGGFASGERSAREVGVVERNFQTRIGQDRAKVERHLLAIAEVMGGLMAVHGNAGLPVELIGSLTYSVYADSTMLLDSEQRIERLTKGLNLTGQSGFINPKPVIWKIWELLGEDPSQIVIDPQPKPPEPVKVSVSKAEDIINPVVLATLFRTGQAPNPQDLQAAVALLTAATQSGLPVIPAVEAADPNAPPRDPATPGMANADWQEQPRINKRDQDS